MARKIRPLSEIGTDILGAPEPTTDSPKGVVFVNNYLNREFTLQNQAKFKFQTSRQVFTDPAQIAHLRSLITESVNARIFEEKPEPVAEEQELEPEPEPVVAPIIAPVIEPTPEPPAQPTE